MTMNKGPKISIITACYNAEKTIEQTIQSVLNQTYDNIEYIIIDGASTDGTMDIVNKYKDQIDIIISEPDEGIYDALNKGITASSGDFLIFINSDDVLYDYLVIEDVVEEIRLIDNPLILYGNVEYIDTVNGTFRLFKREINLETIKNGHMPHHQGTFFSKKIFKKYGLYSKKFRLASDYEFTTRYFEECLNDIYHINRVISKFRVGGLSTIVQYGKKTWLDESREIVKSKYDLDLLHNPLTDNFNLMKAWLNFSIRGINITDTLNFDKNIAIFGSGDVAVYLMEELSKNNKKPLVIIDNDEYKHGRKLNDIVICSPMDNIVFNIETILLSVEANVEKDIINQLKAILGDHFNNIKVISWKNLVSESNVRLFG